MQRRNPFPIPSLFAALAFLRTGDRDEAEDLAQEALAQAWCELRRLRDPAAFGGWLRRIATNACRDWCRRGRPWPASLDGLAEVGHVPDPAPLPGEVVLRRERQRAWREVLGALPIANQQAILLHVWSGWTYAQIAAYLDVPVSTVEGRIDRARVQLRERLRAELVELLGEMPRRR